MRGHSKSHLPAQKHCVRQATTARAYLSVSPTGTAVPAEPLVIRPAISEFSSETICKQQRAQSTISHAPKRTAKTEDANLRCLREARVFAMKTHRRASSFSSQQSADSTASRFNEMKSNRKRQTEQRQQQQTTTNTKRTHVVADEAVESSAHDGTARHPLHASTRFRAFFLQNLSSFAIVA